MIVIKTYHVSAFCQNSFSTLLTNAYYTRFRKYVLSLWCTTSYNLSLGFDRQHLGAVGCTGLLWDIVVCHKPFNEFSHFAKNVRVYETHKILACHHQWSTAYHSSRNVNSGQHWCRIETHCSTNTIERSKHPWNANRFRWQCRTVNDPI